MASQYCTLHWNAHVDGRMHAIYTRVALVVLICFTSLQFIHILERVDMPEDYMPCAFTCVHFALHGCVMIVIHHQSFVNTHACFE